MAQGFYNNQSVDERSYFNALTCPQSVNTTDISLVPFQQVDQNRNSVPYFGNPVFNVNSKNTNATVGRYVGQSLFVPVEYGGGFNNPQNQQQFVQQNSYFNRNRYTPYQNRPPLYSNSLGVGYQPQAQQYTPVYSNGVGASASTGFDSGEQPKLPANSLTASTGFPYSSSDHSQSITLQIKNLDGTMDENSLRLFLLNQLKPITPVVSLVFEGNTHAKITVPDITFAKQVVSNLHRKKIGHKRMVVSYVRDSTSTEINTLRCQVAGLLKDVPYCTLSIIKFRELFQSRFKASLNVWDLYKMQDICTITTNNNEEKYINLNADLVNSIENSPLMEGLQHSVPYCTLHFKREQHKGWAEQDIEPLPNVFMTISELQNLIYPLLKQHPGDIPVASLVHCIAGELGIPVKYNDNGVNLEHLICCVQGIQITSNNFGIKILGWLEPESVVKKESSEGRIHSKNGLVADSLYQISREVVELIKMSPKSTMKFSCFIPAYHNHFGKQCRVADYGYTKLIELFEALSSVVQIMGDGENRQITLTHPTQIRRFTSDLLRVLRSQGNKSVLLSHLPQIFSQTQNRHFDITDYGVCDIVDILDGLVNSNIVSVSTIQNGNDILISIPKRKQTQPEIEKTSVFAGEVVELFRNAPQYSILFQKFVRLYHYHFGYQCRLSDYGFLKLGDLIEAIHGIVDIEFTNDEGKRIYLLPAIARRVFAEQIEEVVKEFSKPATMRVKFSDVLQLHKKKFGYQIQPQTLGYQNMSEVVKKLPYIEVFENDGEMWISCLSKNTGFRNQCYRACKIMQELKKDKITMNELIVVFYRKYNDQLSERIIHAMQLLIEVKIENDVKYVRLTKLAHFLFKLIKTLERKHMSVSDIKSVLNIGIADCFQFGFPNLYCLLQAFPDLFVIEQGSTQDKSEVGLVAHGDLVAHVPYSVPRAQQSNGKQSRKPLATVTSGDSRQPLQQQSHFKKSSKPNQSIDNSQCMYQEYCANQNAANTPANNQRPQLPPLSSSLNSSNKENCSFATFDGSFNSSSMSDPNSSCNSMNSSLWHRRKMKFFNDILEISAPAYPCFEPPKPDSPPQYAPFWMDPVWTNGPLNSTQKEDMSLPLWMDPVWISGSENVVQKNNSLSIALPELKSTSILPLLISPQTNFENMFNFDSPDKKIA